MKIKKLYKDSILPTRANPTDSGMDVYANNCVFKGTEQQFPFKLYPMERVLIGTGIALSIQEGQEIQVRPRSGLAIKNGISIVNTPGTVDCGFLGEIRVILINLSSDVYEITKDMKIAQMVLCPIILEPIEEVDKLDLTPRGSNGFGSTGV
jgi:dUTP pyrophosphatase